MFTVRVVRCADLILIYWRHGRSWVMVEGIKSNQIKSSLLYYIDGIREFRNDRWRWGIRLVDGAIIEYRLTYLSRIFYLGTRNQTLGGSFQIPAVSEITVLYVSRSLARSLHQMHVNLPNVWCSAGNRPCNTVSSISVLRTGTYIQHMPVRTAVQIKL